MSDEDFRNENPGAEHWVECPNCGSDSIFDNDDYYECDECEFKWDKHD